MFKNLIERLKARFSDTASWLALGSNAYAIYKLASSYPGVADESALRNWLHEACAAGGKVADLTETEVDDKIVETAANLISDDESWRWIYDIVIDFGKVSDCPNKIDEPENAATVIAAVGLIVKIIQKIRERKKSPELAVRYSAISKRKRELAESRKLGEMTVDGSKESAPAHFKRLFKRPLDKYDVTGSDCGDALAAEMRNFVIAYILFEQSVQGKPIINGNNTMEFDIGISRTAKALAVNGFVNSDINRLCEDLLRAVGGDENGKK